MRRYKATVLGASGFAGAELLRRLWLHPEVEVVRACAADHVGEPVTSAHPHLEGLIDLKFENPPAEQAVAGVDVVLMGLPHQASIEIVQATLGRDVRIVDLSGAFRLQSADAYARYYDQPHPRPDLLREFVYGLPELNREAIRRARYVASPGCFATAVELGLLAFARAGLVTGAVDSVGITGSSGSGATPSVTTHHPTRAQNLRTYRPLVHQHAPEIEATLHAAGARELSLHFVPVSAPLSRGIFVTSFFRVPARTTSAELSDAIARQFEAEPFVRMPAKRLPEVVAISGSNYAEVGFSLGPVEGDVRTVTAFTALDNLVKGGAGQAIQNMNLLLGLDERTSLQDPGGYP